MKIEKAIEILTKYQKDYLTRLDRPDFDFAVQLGLEALKCLEGLRHLPYGSPLPLLPGETTEEEPKRR